MAQLHWNSTHDSSEESHRLLSDSTNDNATDTNKPTPANDNIPKIDSTMAKLSAFNLARFIASVAIQLIMKFWALCATATLILLLLYHMYGGIVSLLLLIIAVLGLAYNCQDMLLYYPDQPPHSRIFVESSSTFGLPSETVNVKTRDGVQINMMLIKQPPEKLKDAPTVILFHGNAGNIGHRLMNASALYSYSGVNVLLAEYRGYGKSLGSPSENGLYIDAQTAMDFLIKQKDLNLQKLVVFGRSLGGAVAIELCSQPYYASHIMCLAIENTFTSLPDIGRHLFDFKVLHYLPNALFKNKYPSNKLIKKVKVPTLFLSGLADQLIPPKMMQELYDLSGSTLKRMAFFQEGTHNETWQCQGYYETLSRFLGEVQANQMNGGGDPEGVYSEDMPFNDGGAYQL